MSFLFLAPIPGFSQKLSHQEAARATIASSLDPQHPGFCELHFRADHPCHCCEHPDFAGIAGWVLLSRQNEPLVAQSAVLDLRNRSVPRGGESNPASNHWRSVVR